MVAFPLLTDDEPSLASVRIPVHATAPPSPSSTATSSSSSSSFAASSSSLSFQCVSKHLFALTDESRDRGSAKIAVITVQLRHPTLAGSSLSSRSNGGSLSYTASFKIDGRKSFSNAPFKKYYRRGVHAAWFAEPSSHVGGALPEGRVLLLLTQRAGRPNGKGFTGLRHDTTTHSPRHPLLCLASNSVEYYLSVFINQSSRPFADEPSALVDWTQVAVDVSARFDAGAVRFEPLTRTAERQTVQAPLRRRLPSPVLVAPSTPTHVPHLSAHRSLVSHSSSASETCSPSSSSSESAPRDAAATPLLASSDEEEDACMEDDAHSTDAHQWHAAFYPPSASVSFDSLPGEDELAHLPDESTLDHQEWSWEGVVGQSTEAIRKGEAMDLSAQSQSAFLSAANADAPSSACVFAPFLPSEEASLLPPAFLADESSSSRPVKRARLTIDQSAEPLFPHALQPEHWIASPIGYHQLQAIAAAAAPLCSPLPDFAHALYPF